MGAFFLSFDAMNMPEWADSDDNTILPFPERAAEHECTGRHSSHLSLWQLGNYTTAAAR